MVSQSLLLHCRIINGVKDMNGFRDTFNLSRVDVNSTASTREQFIIVSKHDSESSLYIDGKRLGKTLPRSMHELLKREGCHKCLLIVASALTGI